METQKAAFHNPKLLWGKFHNIFTACWVNTCHKFFQLLPAATAPCQKIRTLCPQVPATATVPAACHSCQGRVGLAACWEVSSSNISSIGAFWTKIWMFSQVLFCPCPPLVVDCKKRELCRLRGLVAVLLLLSLSPQHGPKRAFSAMLFLSSGPHSLLWWLPSSEEGLLRHHLFFVPRVTIGHIGI